MYRIRTALRNFIAAAVLLGAVSCSGESSVDGLIDRTLGKGASKKIEVRIDPSLSGEGDVFVISANPSGRKPMVRASNLSSATAGLGWYLRYYAGIGISWNNPHADISGIDLPVPSAPEKRVSDTEMRYYLNYCTFSYSSALWNWDRWQQEIDWMALHGVNMPLMLVGADCVWKSVLEELGYTQDEINDFVAGPGFQAWWLMGNLQGWGGPNPQWWYDRQKNLSEKMLSRMRELGMEPVLPGYAGLLPDNIGTKLGWDVLEQGKWCRGFQRPSFQEPTDDKFMDMARIYYRHLTDLMGKSRFYSMDPFHEGGNPDQTDLYAAYRAINDAMHDSFPDARWVIQSWDDNPRFEAQDAIPVGDFVVLDLFSDGDPKWQSEEGYRGHDWLFCMLHNFGGRIGIHGRLESMMKQYFEARRQYPDNLSGVGVTTEGIGTNPILYDALFDLPWLLEDETDSWVSRYVEYRYGSQDPDLLESWRIVSSTALACPGYQAGTSEPIVCARPSLSVRSASRWGTSALYYKPDTLKVALSYLERGSSSVTGDFSRANLEYDLADLRRQVLTDGCIPLLDSIRTAYEGHDMALFKDLSDSFLDRILELDDLLSSQPEMTYGYHAQMARSVCDEVPGTTERDRDWMVWNLRTLITVWGPEVSSNDGGLSDYSNREWSGLLRDYYYPRWKLFFDRLYNGEDTPDAHEWYSLESSYRIAE